MQDGQGSGPGYYHALARHMARLANQAVSGELRAAYLELAQKWVSLAMHMEQSRERRNRVLSGEPQQETLN
jgi:hypothetical protein